VISQLPKGVCRSGEWVFKRKALLLVAISIYFCFLFDGWSLRNFDIFTTFNGDVYIETMKYIIYIGVPKEWT